MNLSMFVQDFARLLKNKDSVTPPRSRSDPIGGSEPKSEARDYLYYILYTETLIDMFFLRAVLVPVVYK